MRYTTYVRCVIIIMYLLYRALFWMKTSIYNNMLTIDKEKLSMGQNGTWELPVFGTGSLELIQKYHN